MKGLILPQRDETFTPPAALGVKLPRLPRVLLVMSLPLYLAFVIKYDLLPTGYIFVVLYSWAILSSVLVPFLCTVECVLLLKAWLGNDPQRKHALRWHTLGLLGGVGGMLAAFAVR